MKQLKNYVLFTLFAASLLFNFISCQKQKDVDTPTIQKQTNNTTHIAARMPNEKRCRIALDMAVDFTKRWRETKAENDIASIELPIEGVRDILNTAAEYNQDLLGIRLYIGKAPDGQMKIVYVGMKKDTKEDIISFENPRTGTLEMPIEDQGNLCPSSCYNTNSPLR